MDGVPGANVIRFSCDHCGSVFKVKPEHAKKIIKCTSCNHNLEIPEFTPLQLREMPIELGGPPPPPTIAGFETAFGIPAIPGEAEASGIHVPPAPTSTSGLAITSLLLGVLGCIPILGIAAVVLGIVAIGQIDKSEGRIGGRGMAVAGSVIGGIFAVLGIVAALLLPALNASRTTARQMQNSTQLRGIHQAVVTYSQANKFWFPGATSTGKVHANAAISNRHGALMELQDKDWFEPMYNISPGETDSSITSEGLVATTASERGSFAVLEYAINPTGGNLSTLGTLEWRDQLNTSAIVLSDRNTGSPTSPSSVWSSGGWEGSVVFGDNHVQFELSDGPFDGMYGMRKGNWGTGRIGMLFSCCGGNDGDGRMVQD